MTAQLPDPPPLALYIHLPWCLHKCSYCDFNSHPSAQPPQSEYIDALLADLRLERPLVEGRELVSVFLGGGTPSLFAGGQIGRLLEGVNRLLPLCRDCEITLEANPGTADIAHFAGYRAAGVNRLSIGVQSFDDAALMRLERIHDGQTARRALELARAAGFERINLDLMYGLPGQSVAQASADLRQALALDVEHLSRYQLTLEPGTRMSRNPPPLPDEDRICDMEEEGAELLAEAGLRQYEVSAHARPGAESRHNLNYWRFGDYLGIGAGAHGKLTLEQGVWRRRRLANPERYMAAAGTQAAVPEQRRLNQRELLGEFLLNALRLAEGFEADLFAQRTGLPLERLSERLARPIELGLIEWQADRIRPSQRGYRLLNSLLELALPD